MTGHSDRIVTVFGGTGFLGRRVVRFLRKFEFSVRIASRHPDRARKLFGSDDLRLETIEADIHQEQAVADAVAGVYGVVNAISLYVEHAQETFHSVHVEAARRVAAQATRAGVTRLTHVSGIGSDAASQSLYIRKRGEGELVTRAAFAGAALIRPAVMFGPDDAFLAIILKRLLQLPIYPMFGRGLTRLQPAYVEDVAEAIARTLQGAETYAITYECGGPQIYSYDELIRTIAWEAGLRPMLIPVPFAAWYVLAWALEKFPNPLITRNQVELMQADNVVSPGMPGFQELGILPHSISDTLQELLYGH
jgi:uncharacterized protein YbjT (DUF2867 family)